MKYRIFVFFFCFSIGISYADSLERESRRLQEEKRERMERTLKSPQEVEASKLVLEPFSFEKRIHEITLEGNTLLPPLAIKNWKEKYSSLESWGEVENAMQDLENEYFKRGYITTRVRLDFESSDLSAGKLVLHVEEGKIEKVLYEGEEKKEKTAWTFPWREHAFLNIRDLDQGVDNLGEDAKFRILPGTVKGNSILEVNREKTTKVFGEVNYNNLGQEATGEHRIRTSLGVKNLLGFNESWYGYYQTKLQRQRKDRDTKNYLFSFTLPFQYYQASYQIEKSSYKQTIPALGRQYTATGDTRVQRFGIRRVLYRNEDGKWDFGVNLALKDIYNYIDEVQLITGSRHLSILSLDQNYTGRVGGGLFQTNLGVHFGLRQFGATKDRELWYSSESSPKAQFRKYTLDMSWYRPISQWHYRTNLGLQYSKDILYSSEKLSLGDETSVRGFQESGVQGETGFYLRNEIGYDGWKIGRPFIAYDIGEVRKAWKEEGVSSRELLQGLSAGLLFQFEHFETKLVFSKAIDYPSTLKVNSHEVYLSMTYRF